MITTDTKDENLQYSPRQSKEQESTGGYLVGEHYAVDLGLSVCWATCNIGAKQPTDRGKMVHYGMVAGCKLGDENFPKGNISGTSYDIASSEWGEDWRMPTKDEFYELMTKCQWTFRENYAGSGMSGYVVSREGQHIFLPTTGYKRYDDFKEYSVIRNPEVSR